MAIFSKKTKSKVTKQSINWHKSLGWFAAIALIVFALSGFTHPLLSWTGPKAARYYPPQALISAQDANAIPEILTKHNISQAQIVKIIPADPIIFDGGKALQITQNPSQPRRYFHLDASATEQPNYDKSHAIWLARYYTGLTDRPIASVTFQNKFNGAYPWVNRLLPVYRIRFEDENNSRDGLTIYTYTELGVMASLSNSYKASVQSIFRALHTFSWLDNFNNARTILISLMMLSLIAMSLTGIALVALIKNRKMPLSRKIHRCLAYVVFLPLLMFSASGFYHLLHYSYADREAGLQLPAPMDLSHANLATNISALDRYEGQRVNALNLIQHDGKFYYRLSVPAKALNKTASIGDKQNSAPISRKARYKGAPMEKKGVFIDASTGTLADLTDQQYAQSIAITHAKAHSNNSSNSAQDINENNNPTRFDLIKRFGPTYDFRNKRLPVWQFDFATDKAYRIFIDPATGARVDQSISPQRLEDWSFSLLHKWSMLTPIMGREKRDIIIVIFLFLSCILTAFGIRMLIR